ncbi:conserved hypothetical protein [Shewanella sp. ANA-3]|uniref:DUF2541 family protein n=1 Tax=Shewanella sp. (strain ANA-3) TaxID=94122 RepID=UPI00005E14F2|nr:DUF2541 family protein [Shewanella sp. ANA-3]ABK46714.1 conserved hypothetical protein [Shewanella sp. ANA-3]
MLLKTRLFSTKIINQLIICLLLMFTTSVAYAKNDDKDDKITLGRTLLLGIGDHPAIIPLIICRQAKHIRIKAERDVSIDRVVVTYGDDKTRTVRFDTELEKDEHSEWKSLGARRCVKKIEVYGNSDRSKAGIKVLGRK